MATNKRKDAAALFELIDKSTLKVPKNAGALKIPSWWSSKTNPPAPDAPSLTPAASSPPAPIASAPAAPPVPEPPVTPPAPVARTTPVAAPTSPRVSSAPSAETPQMRPAPSVRPPVNTGAETAAAPLPTEPLAPRPTEPTDEAELEPMPNMATASPSIRPPGRPVTGHAAASSGAPRQPVGVFAPQTYDPTRLARRPTVFGRAPIWLLAAGTAGGCVVIVLAVLLLRGCQRSTPQGSNSNTSVTIRNPGGTPPAPRPTVNGGQPQPVQPQPIQPQPTQPPALPPPPEQRTTKPGRVVPATEVTRVPGLNYLVICSTPSERVAIANAQFLVEHGMSDITIERKSDGGFTIISVQGFAKLTDPQAESLRKLVVSIGREHPDAKKRGRSVYWDAYYRKVQRAN